MENKSTLAKTSHFLQSLAKDGLFAFAGSCIIALASQVSFYFPYSIVPFTIQAQAVLLTAALLGKRRGLLAVLFYLIEGASGLPVFAGGAGGVLRLIGPTGGYLMSYLPVAYAMGALFEKYQTASKRVLFSFLLLGNAIVLVAGALWLSAFVGFKGAIAMGVTPFIVNDILKCAATLAVYRQGHALVKWLS